MRTVRCVSFGSFEIRIHHIARAQLRPEVTLLHTTSLSPFAISNGKRTREGLRYFTPTMTTTSTSFSGKSVSTFPDTPFLYPMDKTVDDENKNKNKNFTWRTIKKNRGSIFDNSIPGTGARAVDLKSFKTQTKRSLTIWMGKN